MECGGEEEGGEKAFLKTEGRVGRGLTEGGEAVTSETLFASS